MTTRIPAYMAGIPGAAGNGTTDDGAALAAAKAAHPTKLQLGGGLTYKITANLTAGWRMLDGKLLPFLVKAVQVLAARVEELERQQAA